MDYSEALQFIHSRGKFGSYKGLERMEELMNLLGNPQKNLKFVHVAGTNGKGSTVKLISAALIKAGYRTGTYISPFVETFNERIQINFKNISNKALADAVSRVKSAVEIVDKTDSFSPVTEFECITATAFCYYYEEKCDIVVLETGLGGKFDATNVIESPIVSVLTSISLDHTDILGDTVEKIAAEKCGIIKKGRPVVTAPSQSKDVLVCIREACAVSDSKLYETCEENAHNIRLFRDGSDFEFGGLDIHIKLIGRYQVSNSLTALQALFVLREEGLKITDEDIKTAFGKCDFFGRICYIRDNIILDGAHNPDGVNALCDYIDSFIDGRLICVVGMLKDKNYRECIKKIASYADIYIAVEPNNPRKLSANENASEAKRYCSEVVCYPEANEAVKYLNSILKNDDTVIVCGSLYLLCDMKNCIERYIL